MLGNLVTSGIAFNFTLFTTIFIKLILFIVSQNTLFHRKRYFVISKIHNYFRNVVGVLDILLLLGDNILI